MVQTKLSLTNHVTFLLCLWVCDIAEIKCTGLVQVAAA